jgi:AraC family transcriptional regulator
MPNSRNINRGNVGMTIKSSPEPENLLPTGAVRHRDFNSTERRGSGQQFVRGLLTRTVDYEQQAEEDFSRFHIREAAVAGLYLTETGHPSGYRIPKHAHEMESLYLLLAGSLTEQFGREDVKRNADELIFTPADRPHSNVFQESGGRCLIIELHPMLLSRVCEWGGLPANLKSFRGQPAWLARRLYNEFRSGSAMSPLVVEGLVLEIFGEICRQPAQLGSRQLQRTAIQAREFLDATFTQPVSLADIGKAVNLHPIYLARVFRHTYRCSVGEYVRRRRVEFVCLQLSDSDKPLAEIASEAGFCDQAHLTRTFHRLTGFTPGQYRMIRRG